VTLIGGAYDRISDRTVGEFATNRSFTDVG
jgi:hypothetical protein